MADLAKKARRPRWQPSPTPTGEYDEGWLDDVLYGGPPDKSPDEIDLIHPILIGQCIQQYRDEFSHRRPSSAYHVAEAINHMLLSLGMHENLPVAHLTKDKMLKYRAMLLEGTAPRTSHEGPNHCEETGAPQSLDEMGHGERPSCKEPDGWTRTSGAVGDEGQDQEIWIH